MTWDILPGSMFIVRIMPDQDFVYREQMFDKNIMQDRASNDTNTICNMQHNMQCLGALGRVPMEMIPSQFKSQFKYQFKKCPQKIFDVKEWYIKAADLFADC